jgi:hypothetical protein
MELVISHSVATEPTVRHGGDWGDVSTSRPTDAGRTRVTTELRDAADERFGGRTTVVKIVINDEGEKALSPAAEELLRRRAAEVGFSTLEWIVQPLELHAEQDDEDEPEDEE